MIRIAAPIGFILLMASPTVGYAQLTADNDIARLATPDPIVDRARAVQCLSIAIAYEAAYEPVEGQQAIAEVVLNRTRHPSYPKTVCGVVFAGSQRRTGCQFSFTCDGSLNRRLPESVLTFARTIATAALAGQNPPRVSGATHYHADYVSPYWAPSLTRITKIGAHIFYRGAGTRDRGLLAPSYTPFGEPATDRLGAFPDRAEGGIRSPSHQPGQSPGTMKSPPVFAPWGLTPPALGRTG